MNSSSYLDGLNDDQRAAVESLEGPLLVLAGAGTGKTRVLTTRLAHIIHTGNASPSQLLAVTFTNKAARQMIDRVGNLLGHSVDGLWLGTFHSVAVRILRMHAEIVGLKSNFTILDTDDQTRLLKQLLQARNVDEKRWPARNLCTMIQRWKDRGLTPKQVENIDFGDFANGEAYLIFREYQERLRVLNAVDFGDLLTHCITLFQNETDILSNFHKRFRYILVDEYQDTNIAQYLWLRLLAGTGQQNICCVGDDDQSIYGWRGAEVGNILRFEKDFPGAEIIRLEQNYRSSGNILAAASGLIEKNVGRLGKTLWTDDDLGHPVVVTGNWDGEEEARAIGIAIEEKFHAGSSLNEFAILVRASFQTRAFEERFLSIGLPYRVIGGPRFYERQEIRDAIAYIRVLIQPDDDLAFERILNVPKRGLGDASQQIIHQLARSSQISLHQASRIIIGTDELKSAARNSLSQFLENFERWRSELDEKPHWEILEVIMDESGYTSMWQADKSPQAPGRLENIKELISAIEDFESFSAFIEHVSLVMDRENGREGGVQNRFSRGQATKQNDMVNIMTLHSAKGLEFDTVFLPGWEEGLFPHQLALDEKGSEGLEEERRLAYVGLTRARKEAQILFAANRRVYNQWISAIPSRFIDDLPVDNIITNSLIKNHPKLYEKNSYSHYTQDSITLVSKDSRNDLNVLWEEEKPVKNRNSGSRFKTNDRVVHRKFGVGRVSKVDGEKLDIIFDRVGIKKVVDRFVEPEK
tara:strand:- start:39688 stop:41946 length:2259 start_codon:yes stop_codon:yes gene_type:complete